MVGAAGLKADVELCNTTEEGGCQMNSVPRSGPLPSAQRQSSPQATYYAGVLSPRPDSATPFPKETRRIIAPSDQATPTQ